MIFGDAIQNLKDGKKVRRMVWPKSSYLILHRMARTFVDHNGKAWAPSPIEMFADDWELVE